jgi:hypothetical protein
VNLPPRADQYGTTGMTGTPTISSTNPNSAELLANGHVLIADENNNRVIEVDPTDNIVWQYATNLQQGSNPGRLSALAV